MSDLLPVPRGTSVIVEFVYGTFHSRLIHWVKDGQRWRSQECAGTDCVRCLDGDRVQQRFSATVRHEGKPRTLDLPYAAWVQVLHRMKINGSEFFELRWELIRHPDFPGYNFELVKAQ